MDLSKILSISGRPGLYQVISQLKNSVLVESLLDKKRFPAFPHEKISTLEEIAVFTATEDKPLKDIFKAFHDKLEGKPALDAKSDNKMLQAFFVEVVPDYDVERVYISDIRKIVSWYNLLLEHKILDFTEKEEEKPEEKTEVKKSETTQETPEEEKTEPKKKKSAGKKAVSQEAKEKKKEAPVKKKTK
jgi:hypothetical protein